MELNYRPANYTGWPVPALYHYFLCISLHATKLRKISESCNFFRNYFTSKCKVFSIKFSIIYPRFLRSLPTLFPWLSKKCQKAS